MRKLILPYLGLSLALSLSGCGLMEDAFKAGFIIALIIAAIVGLLIWILHFAWNMLNKYFPAIRNYASEFAEMELETEDRSSF